ncbi:MAG: magnesium/cobalt transporter CorA [Gemmatimonadota bacterium]
MNDPLPPTAPSHKAGLPPGTLLHVGEPSSRAVTVRCLHYSADAIEEITVEDPSACADRVGRGGVCWIDVDGLHDTGVVRSVCTGFGVHPLVQEDIVSAYQRPKYEDHGRHLYVVLRVLDYDAASLSLTSSQLSLVLGESYVLSFQEQPEPVADLLRSRLRGGEGRLRRLGADYLAYCLLDLVIDHYYGVLDRFEDRIDLLEDQLLSHPDAAATGEIQALKRDLLTLRRSIWPLREVLTQLQRHESKLVAEETRPYLRDLYDHTVQVMDAVEVLRELTSDMLEIYLSNVSNRMNEVMKVLTVFASIFIPLTFLVGVYGMNFHYMPELAWRWSYPALWLFMILLTAAMLFVFRRRHWW